MTAKNLVIEFDETESASDRQSRLDQAGEDGFFLVNVVGSFAYLRTSVVQPQKPKKTLPMGTKVDQINDAARSVIADNLAVNPDISVSGLISKLAEAGIVRKKTWVAEARLAIRRARRTHVRMTAAL